MRAIRHASRQTKTEMQKANDDITKHNANPVFFCSLIYFFFFSCGWFLFFSPLLPRSYFLASSTRQSRPGALHVLQLQRPTRFIALRILACLGIRCCCSPFRRLKPPRRLKIRVGRRSRVKRRTPIKRRPLATATAAAADIFLDVPPPPGNVLLHLKHKRLLVPAGGIKLPRVGRVLRTGQRRRHATVAAVREARDAGLGRRLGRWL